MLAYNARINYEVNQLGFTLTPPQIEELRRILDRIDRRHHTYSSGGYYTVVSSEHLREFWRHYHSEFWLPSGRSLLRRGEVSDFRNGSEDELKQIFDEEVEQSGIEFDQLAADFVKFHRSRVLGARAALSNLLLELNLPKQELLGTCSFPDLLFSSSFDVGARGSAFNISWIELLSCAVELEWDVHSRNIRFTNVFPDTVSLDERFAKCNLDVIGVLAAIAELSYGKEDSRCAALVERACVSSGGYQLELLCDGSELSLSKSPYRILHLVAQAFEQVSAGSERKFSAFDFTLELLRMSIGMVHFESLDVKHWCTGEVLLQALNKIGVNEDLGALDVFSDFAESCLSGAQAGRRRRLDARYPQDQLHFVVEYLSELTDSKKGQLRSGQVATVEKVDFSYLDFLQESIAAKSNTSDIPVLIRPYAGAELERFIPICLSKKDYRRFVKGCSTQIVALDGIADDKQVRKLADPREVSLARKYLRAKLGSDPSNANIDYPIQERLKLFRTFAQHVERKLAPLRKVVQEAVLCNGLDNLESLSTFTFRDRRFQDPKRGKIGRTSVGETFLNLLEYVAGREYRAQCDWKDTLKVLDWDGGVQRLGIPAPTFATSPTAILHIVALGLFGAEDPRTKSLVGSTAYMHLEALDVALQTSDPNQRLIHLTHCLLDAHHGLNQCGQNLGSLDRTEAWSRICTTQFANARGDINVAGIDLVKQLYELLDVNQVYVLRTYQGYLSAARGRPLMGRTEWDAGIFAARDSAIHRRIVVTSYLERVRQVVRSSCFKSQSGRNAIAFPGRKRPELEQLRRQLAAVSPDLLFEGLCLFGWEKDSEKAYRAFRASLREEQAPLTATVTEGNSRSKPTGPELYVSTLAAAMAGGNMIDFSAVGLDAHREYLRELCLSHYTGDPALFLEQVRVAQGELYPSLPPEVRTQIDTVLDKITPPLVEFFEREGSIKAPATIKSRLFSHQLRGLADNVLLGKAINGDERGLGKTCTALAVCEYRRYKRVLWVTDVAARANTYKEILRRVDCDETQVKVFAPELRTATVFQLEKQFERVKYLLINYQTLRSAMLKRPDIYEFINRWTELADIRTESVDGQPNAEEEGGIVIDEADRFDNPKSQRYRAVHGLRCLNRYLLAGTLFQSHYHRFGHTLSLANPREYPDPLLMVELCKDQRVARSLINQNVSLNHADTVAKPFEPLDKVPAAEQLATGVPHIPREYNHDPILVPSSAEQSRAYIALALFFDEWLAANPRVKELSLNGKTLRQIILMRQALMTPQKLGLGPALELIGAAKRIALPAMQSGQKVLIFCQSRLLVEDLVNDPELQRFGLVRLDGTVPADDRMEAMHFLEELPQVQIGVAQFDAAAASNSIRSIDHVIYLELPKFVSIYQQSRGRARRNLGPDDARFARMGVHYWHLIPTLDPVVLREIDNEDVRQAFEFGTIAEIEYGKLVDELDRIAYFTRRGKGYREPREKILKRYMRDLAVVASTFENKRESSAEFLMALAKRKPKALVDHDNPVKERRWRKRAKGFIEKHRVVLSDRKAQVLSLVGPEGTELPMYDELGFERSAIHAVEGRECNLFLESLTGSGCKLYSEAIENVVKKMTLKGIEVDVTSIDYDHFLTPIDVETFRWCPISAYSILLKNAQIGRENNDAKELLDIVAPGEMRRQQRAVLDQVLLKLVGTASRHQFGSVTQENALKVYVAVKALSEQWGEELAPALQSVDPSLTAQLIRDLITDTFFGSPAILDCETFTYRSIGRTSFLSNFALLKRLPLEAQQGPFAELAQRMIGASLGDRFYHEDAKVLRSHIRHEFKIEGEHVVAYRGRGRIAAVATDELVRELESFKLGSRHFPNLV